MEIGHDFNPAGDPDPMQGRLDQAERQLALYQKALGHDLPNQMVALQGLARMVELELGPAAAPDALSFAGRLATLARQVDENMRALAALGRLCSHSGPLEKLDLGDLIREAAAEVKVLFAGRAVDYHLQDDMPIVTTTRAPLYQVLTQLLRNAMQAANAGRELAVEIGAHRVAPDGVEIRISDNGRGMSPFQLEQVRATLAGEPGGGTGLGLVLVRQVVAGWRGAVRIGSEPGRGTMVTLLARTW